MSSEPARDERSSVIWGLNKAVDNVEVSVALKERNKRPTFLDYLRTRLMPEYLHFRGRAKELGLSIEEYDKRMDRAHQAIGLEAPDYPN